MDEGHLGRTGKVRDGWALNKRKRRGVVGNPNGKLEIKKWGQQGRRS